MTVNFTLGRIGLEVDVADVSQWDSNGPNVSVAFSTDIGSQSIANAIRQQLLGYVDSPDEEFVAVTWADDPSVNGYYRVLGASVVPDADLAFDGLYYFSAALFRLTGGFAFPIIQTEFVQRPRTNVHGLAENDTYPIMGVPLSSTFEALYDVKTNAYRSPGSGATMVTETGTIRQFNLQTSTDGDLSLFQRSIPPADYYAGAATLKAFGNVVVGRQIPFGSELDFELSNGLLRLTPDLTSGMQFKVETFDTSLTPDAYSTPTLWQLRIGDSAISRLQATGPYAISVLRNNPEEVTIRLTVKRSGSVSQAFLDMTIRRGFRAIACRLYSVYQADTFYPAVSSLALDEAGWDGSVGAWYEPNTFAARNAAYNPKLGDIGTGAAGWTAIGGTATGRVFTGATTAFRVTASAAHAATAMGAKQGGPQQNIITPGQVSIRARVKSSVASRQVALRLRYYNSGGSQIGGDVVGSTVTLSATPETWQDLELLNQTAPALTNRVDLQVLGAGASAWVIGDTLDTTWLQIIEDVATLPAFWDGDTADGGGFQYMWEGEDELSSSVQFSTPSWGTSFWLATPDENLKDREGITEVVAFGSASFLHPIWDFGVGMFVGGSPLGDIRAYQNVFSARESVVIT